MAFRAALHHAGASALSHLLRFSEPAEQQRSLACSCGHQARYRELRQRRVLTALGTVEITRPWYLCSHCHQGQFPADRTVTMAMRIRATIQPFIFHSSKAADGVKASRLSRASPHL